MSGHQHYDYDAETGRIEGLRGSFCLFRYLRIELKPIAFIFEWGWWVCRFATEIDAGYLSIVWGFPQWGIEVLQLAWSTFRNHLIKPSFPNQSNMEFKFHSQMNAKSPFEPPIKPASHRNESSKSTFTCVSNRIWSIIQLDSLFFPRKNHRLNCLCLNIRIKLNRIIVFDLNFWCVFFLPGHLPRLIFCDELQFINWALPHLPNDISKAFSCNRRVIECG